MKNEYKTSLYTMYITIATVAYNPRKDVAKNVNYFYTTILKNSDNEHIGIHNNELFQHLDCVKNFPGNYSDVYSAKEIREIKEALRKLDKLKAFL